MTSRAANSTTPAGPARGDGNSGLRVLLTLWRSPLTRNGYSLIASAGMTAVLGLIFWVVAARLYTADQLGVSAALISTLMTLGNISQLNFGNLLNRFLPVSGRRSHRLILFSYATVSLAALLTSGGFLLGIGDFLKDLDFLRQSPWSIAAFLTVSVFWTVFALQDSVLAGLRKSALVPIENTLYALIKLGLLPVLAVLVANLETGIFAAWTVPLPFMVIVINLIIFLKFLPAHSAAPTGQRMVSRATLVRFFGWDYMGTLASMIAMGLAPLLVFKTHGSTAIATYHLAWTIAYPLYLISRSMSMSLLTEAAADPARMQSLVVEAAIHSMLPLVGAATVVLVGAPWIMMLFGKVYAEEGVALVRIIVASTIPWGLVTIYLAVLRAKGQTIAIAIAQAVTLVVVVGLGYLLLTRIGLLGIGYAWLCAHIVVSLGILLLLLRQHGVERVVAGFYQFAASLAHFLADLRARAVNLSLPANGDAVLARLCATAELPDPPAWRPVGEIATLSDVRTLFVGNEQRAGEAGAAPATAILRFAVSDVGNEALHRALAANRLLTAHLAGQSLGVAIPTILAKEEVDGSTWVLERLLDGLDGRQALLRPQTRTAALADAVRLITAIHHQSATVATIGDEWLGQWVDGPLDLIANSTTADMDDGERRGAVDHLRREQHEFWRGRQVPLGLGHGDFYAGNLLFVPAGDAPAAEAAGRARAEPMMRVSAIIDWEQMSTDAPPGLDAVHLAITMRALFSGAEMGDVVRDLLATPAWNEEELAWLSAATSAAEAYHDWPRDPATIRALVGLVWILHVTANSKKSDRYAKNRLWIASNVERVLRADLARSARD